MTYSTEKSISRYCQRGQGLLPSIGGWGVLRDKIIFEERHKCCTVGSHLDLFPQKDIFHQQKGEH